MQSAVVLRTGMLVADERSRRRRPQAGAETAQLPAHRQAPRVASRLRSAASAPTATAQGAVMAPATESLIAAHDTVSIMELKMERERVLREEAKQTRERLLRRTIQQQSGPSTTWLIDPPPLLSPVALDAASPSSRARTPASIGRAYGLAQRERPSVQTTG